MSFVCSLIAIEWATNGDVVTAIITFWVGAMIDAMIIDALATLATKGDEYESLE